MKITLHMCSRGRPLQLTAALISLRDNESGEHAVRYAVAVDVDDKPTIGTLVSLQAKLPLGYRVGERPVSMDALHNQLARDIPADVYVCFIDDALCLTKGWDAEIAELYANNPKGLWWWRSKGEDMTLMPITSEAWRATAGRIFPEHFPFWWGDTWLAEVYMLAAEKPLAFAPIEFIDCPTKTHNMRDLRFWHSFYLWLQPERIAEAKDMALKMGFHTPKITGALARIVGAPPKDFLKLIDHAEATQGDHSEPHEGYKIATARAVARMESGIAGPPPGLALEDLLTPDVEAALRAFFPDLADEMKVKAA